MRDRKLTALVACVTILSLGHTADHIARGDLPLPLSAQSLPFILSNAVIYGALGLSLFLYLRNKVGPGFVAIMAWLGLALGWLGHFSPFTDQTPQYICTAYRVPAVGYLALGWLIALMAALIVTALYAEYVWARASR